MHKGIAVFKDIQVVSMYVHDKTANTRNYHAHNLVPYWLKCKHIIGKMPGSVSPLQQQFIFEPVC